MRRHDAYRGKPNTRKFVPYFLVQNAKAGDLRASLYPSMLIEDLHLGIMPISTHGMSSDFAVRILPESQEAEELVRVGLPTHHGNPSNLTEAVCNFVDEATHVLATYGSTYYEIIYVYENEQRKKIIGFIIDGISNHCIKETLRICWQYIPIQVFRDRAEDESMRRFVWMPKHDLMVLKIPREIGGSRKLKKLLSDLEWLSEGTIPEFALKDMAEQKQSKGYDFPTYRYNQELFLAKRTRNLGWDVRGIFKDETLEYYQIFRNLKFEKSKAILREYIVDELNKTLKKIGNQIGFEAQIEIQGAPTPKDVQNKINELHKGNLQFKDVVDFLFNWAK